MYYILDTNIWIEIARGNIACGDLTQNPASTVVVAPFTIIELIRGTVRNGGRFSPRTRSCWSA
jgi:predicted nucleic acid-binding protein